jgi:carbamoyltransferase
MKKITLGISYGYHDSSAALVIDGVLRSAAAEERFTRQKHDSHFPNYAIQHCLTDAGITIDDVSEVVYHEDLTQKFSRVLASSVSSFPFSRKEFTESMKSWLGKKLWSLNEISWRLKLAPSRIKYLSHHLSHAACAFLSSPFNESAILVVDAVGEWTSSALYEGSWVEGRPKIEKLLELNFPHSLGLIYSAITAYLGFNPNSDECSTMALAAFGKPVYLEKFLKIVQFLPDGTYQVDDSYFNFRRFYESSCSEKFIKEFGPPRSPSETLRFDCLAENMHGATEREIHFANMAATVQKLFETSVIRLADILRLKTGKRNLCLAGGGALNCVANSKIIQEGGFKDYFIPPDPGDGGSAIGAALLVNCYDVGQGPKFTLSSPYMGGSYNEKPDRDMLTYIKPSRLKKYRKRHTPEIENEEWQVSVEANEDSLVDLISEMIKSGLVVGWFQGRFEIGPRALGNRSILIDPSRVDLAHRLSTQIKDRASFRPYGLSISVSDSKKIFDTDFSNFIPAKWMQLAAPLKPEWKPRVRAAVHIDGTTRPQICGPQDNRIFFKLLEALGRKTGLEAVLNTSFNEAGYPLVASPSLALAMFARTPMDALVINQTVIKKVSGLSSEKSQADITLEQAKIKRI